MILKGVKLSRSAGLILLYSASTQSSLINVPMGSFIFPWWMINIIIFWIRCDLSTKLPSLTRHGWLLHYLNWHSLLLYYLKFLFLPVINRRKMVLDDIVLPIFYLSISFLLLGSIIVIFNVHSGVVLVFSYLKLAHLFSK